MGWSVARCTGSKATGCLLARDVQRLLALYGIGGGRAEAVMELARMARVKAGGTSTPARSPMVPVLRRAGGRGQRHAGIRR